MVSLRAGSMASTCSGSSTWIGVKKAIHTPSAASTSSPTQPRDTGAAGSASAAGGAGIIAVGTGGTASAVTDPTAR